MWIKEKCFHAHDHILIAYESLSPYGTYRFHSTLFLRDIDERYFILFQLTR